MTLCSSTGCSYFLADHTFYLLYDLHTEFDLYRIATGFDGAFATGVACQQGNDYPSGHLVPSFFFGLAHSPIVETSVFKLAMIFPTFIPRICIGPFLLQMTIKCVHVVFVVGFCFVFFLYLCCGFFLIQESIVKAFAMS